MSDVQYKIRNLGVYSSVTIKSELDENLLNKAELHKLREVLLELIDDITHEIENKH